MASGLSRIDENIAIKVDNAFQKDGKLYCFL
jgi:hypothetical protein